MPPWSRLQVFSRIELEQVPTTLDRFYGVMAGLVASGLDPGAIHAPYARCRKKYVDARNNPRIKSGDGHDG